jgi:transposase
MADTPSEPLPNDVEALQRMVADLAGQVRKLQSNLSARELLIEHLQIQIAALRRQMYGRKSEKLETEIGQLELKLEELLLDNGEDPPPATAASQARASRARKPLPEHLPRDTVEHLPASNGCPECGAELKLIGEDVAEQLEYVPQSWRVVRHVRPKFSCSCCQSLVQASAPSRPIARGLAGPGLLAHVIVGKYADHLPLYRQAQIYARDGLDLDRSTLSEWVGGVTRLLRPLVQALRRYVIAGTTVHADDTPVPLLAPGKGKTVTGRLWAYVRDERPAGSQNAAALWMAFTPDRRGEHPHRHLQDFRGIIHADGFAGYDKLYDATRTQAACWAHARRKFYELTKSNPSPAAGEAVRRIAALYAIEEQIKGQPPDRRVQVRIEHSKPLIDSMRAWLDTLLPTLSSKSALAGAIQYALNRWGELNTFVQDGRAEIDTDVFDKRFLSNRTSAGSGLTTSSRRQFSPCSDEAPVIRFGQAEPGSLLVTHRFQAVVSRWPRGVPTASRSASRLEFQLAHLPLQQYGARPRIVLAFSEHVPNQDGKLASGSDGGNLLASFSAHPLKESAQRPRRSGNAPNGLDQHCTGLASTLLGNVPMIRSMIS